MKHLRRLSPYRDAAELVKPDEVRRPPMFRKHNFAAWLQRNRVLWARAAAFAKPELRRVFLQRERRPHPVNDPALLQAYKRQLLGQAPDRADRTEPGERRSPFMRPARSFMRFG